MELQNEITPESLQRDRQLRGILTLAGVDIDLPRRLDDGTPDTLDLIAVRSAKSLPSETLKQLRELQVEL